MTCYVLQPLFFPYMNSFDRLFRCASLCYAWAWCIAPILLRGLRSVATQRTYVGHALIVHVLRLCIIGTYHPPPGLHPPHPTPPHLACHSGVTSTQSIRISRNKASGSTRAVHMSRHAIILTPHATPHACGSLRAYVGTVDRLSLFFFLQRVVLTD